MSFFERLRLQHPQVEPGLLTQQYRMDPRICAYPSDRFYGGLLTSVKSEHHCQELPARYPLPSEWCESIEGEQHPVIFVDTSNMENRGEEHVPLTASLRNLLEAR